MSMKKVKEKSNYFKYMLRQFKIVCSPLTNFINNIIFYFRIKQYKNIKKIIYAITPPPSFRNIGDHAQSVAIKKWLKDNFEDYFVLEFDKGEIYKYISSIKKIVNEKDLIFLQSGGNLGDRGLWSENARRLVIKNFPKNRIISLPQTIFFSNTKKGKEELEITMNIYKRHRDLTIMARDKYSFKLAKEYFPKCKTMTCPDFVLYLVSYTRGNSERENILLCLRNDPESVINGHIRRTIKEYIKGLNEGYYEYDNTLDRNIPRENQEKEVEIALSLFRKHKLVITDRLHGIIFSVITKTPCIALRTIDHKLSESVRWFSDLNYITYVEDYEMLPEIISKMLRIDHFNDMDWKRLYFNNLKSKIVTD